MRRLITNYPYFVYTDLEWGIPEFWDALDARPFGSFFGSI